VGTSVRFHAGARIGAYRVVRELARTAAVAAFDTQHAVLPRAAIVKLAMTSAAAVPLLREACLLEAVRHPGVPAVHESGVLAGGRPWIAVELVIGTPLSAARDLAPVDVAAIVRDVAAVLDHAHRRGVVHAGLRPERVLLTDPSRGARVCIVDWCDARAHDASATIPHVPPPGARDYAAPEQTQHDAIDDRADVYALGVIAYRAIAGVRPYDGGGAAVPLAVRCPHAPDELCAVIDQMIARDRFDRPTAAQVGAELAWADAPASRRHEIAGETLTAIPEVEVELVDTDGIPAQPLRIRRPRWTPAAIASADLPARSGSIVSSDRRAEASGEIETPSD
jgi:serine/threonine-protein kinase